MYLVLFLLINLLCYIYNDISHSFKSITNYLIKNAKLRIKSENKKIQEASHP